MELTLYLALDDGEEGYFMEPPASRNTLVVKSIDNGPLAKYVDEPPQGSWYEKTMHMW